MSGRVVASAVDASSSISRQSVPGPGGPIMTRPARLSSVAGASSHASTIPIARPATPRKPRDSRRAWHASTRPTTCCATRSDGRTSTARQRADERAPRAALGRGSADLDDDFDASAGRRTAAAAANATGHGTLRHDGCVPAAQLRRWARRRGPTCDGQQPLSRRAFDAENDLRASTPTGPVPRSRGSAPSRCPRCARHARQRSSSAATTATRWGRWRSSSPPTSIGWRERSREIATW